MKATWFGFVGLMLLLSLAGCGGGGSTPAAITTGGLLFTVVWPERTRLIPLAAESIKIVLISDGEGVAQKVVARPAPPQATSTVSFDNVPTGNVTVTATAYPNPDGTGTAQATGSVVVTVQANQTTSASLTMASTVTQVTVTPVDPSVQRDSSVELAASAMDAGGNMVLTAASNWSWQSSNGNVTLTPNGDRVTVRGIVAGTSVVTARESESGKSGQATVTITATPPPAAYDVVDLGFLPGGGYSEGNAINAQGEVVGWASSPSGDRAFLWRNGVMTDLGVLPGHNRSRSYGINDFTQVVGFGWSVIGEDTGFLWQNGIMTEVAPLSGDPYSQAFAVNNLGHIVGASYPTFTHGDYHAHAYIRTGATATHIADRTSIAYAINDRGQVAGEANARAFLWENGNYTELPMLPNAVGAAAYGINEAGHVVGKVTLPSGETRAVLWKEGQVIDLGPGRAMDINNNGIVVGPSFIWDSVNGYRLLSTLLPAGSGWTLRNIRGINDRGEIVGQGDKGGSHAIVLKPR
jgi:probable HAF family extracellular repeat protein